MCKLYNQFFHLCTKRPQKYITPPAAITTTFTWAMANAVPQEINHAQYVHSVLIKVGDKNPKYIGAGEVLTKIAYEAIGARGQWAMAPNQNTWLKMKVDEEDEVPKAPPVSTRLKRKLEPVLEEKQEEPKKK